MDEVKLNAITIEAWHDEEEMTWCERGGIAGCGSGGRLEGT